MILTTPTSFPLVISLLVSAMLVSGCSSSNDSQSLTDTESLTADNTNTAGDDSAVIANEPVAETSNTTELEVETTESADQAVLETPIDPAVTDHVVQNRTQVNFEIMVPAYQSDALQVRLTWDTKVFNASWVGDELWAAADDFPTNTEHELVVTFSDDNGGITLGQYENVFKTGTNDSEDYQISAEQFNIDQWDTDYDGTINIDELIDGSDPLVNEDSLLEIRDTTEVFLGFIANTFESRIPEERPYDEYYEEQLTYHEGGRPPSGASHIIEINVDENGNGTLSDSRLEGVGLWPIRTSYTGTRTHSENSIRWEGQKAKRQDLADFYITTSSVNTVSIIGERTWNYEETHRYSYDTSDEDSTLTKRQIDLIGEAIEGTSFCQPVSGTVEIETTTPNDRNGPTTRKSITKEIDDQYWRVKYAVTGDEPSDAEYLAREFNSTFQCDFVEF